MTGHTDPELAARWVLARPGARTEWAVVKLGKEGALLRSKAEGRSYRMAGLQVGEAGGGVLASRVRWEKGGGERAGGHRSNYRGSVRRPQCHPIHSFLLALRCPHICLRITFSCVQVQVQDTVGCGDSFASAIVLGYIARHPIPATLALANAVGAATATGRGAGRNVATAEKVTSLLLAAARDGSRPQEQRAAFEAALGNLQELRSMAGQPQVA